MGQRPRVTQPGLAFHALAVARARNWLAEVNRLMDDGPLRFVQQSVTRDVRLGHRT
jgi:hypothetical protein